MKIATAFFLCILAGIVSFIQLQGQIAWKFPKENPYVMMLLVTCNEVLGYMGADRGYAFWTEVKQEVENL